VAIQDITLVVKTKVDQLNKLEKSIDTVEKKIGKVSKKVIVLDTSKAVKNVEKLNDSLEKASKFVRRFSVEAKGFTGVRAISNELGAMNKQLAQARKALNDTSQAIAAEKERLGSLSQAQKNNIRTTQQQNAALSILAITYKKLRIENDAFVAAQTRAFSQKKGGDGLTGGDTFGSIQKRVKVLKEWPETLDASARALQEVNYLLNLAVKDSKAFNLLAKTKIELTEKENRIIKALTPEKAKQTKIEKEQVTWIQKHINELESLKKSYLDLGRIGSQLTNIFKGFGLSTQLGSSAALFGGGMAASGVSGLLKGIGLGGTGVGKSFNNLATTANILAGADAVGKLALGAQGLAVAADQGARAVFEMERTLAKFIPKAFEFATTQGRRGWDRHSAALGEHGGAGIRPADLASVVPGFMRMSAAMALPNDAKDDALFTAKQALKVAKERLRALSRTGLEAKKYADTALYVQQIENAITDEVKERELTLARASDLTRGNLTSQQSERALRKAGDSSERFKGTQKTGFAAFSAEVSQLEKKVQLEKKIKGELLTQTQVMQRTNKLRADAERSASRLFTTEAKRNRNLRARLKLMGKQMGMSGNTKDLESMMLGAGFPLLFGGGIGSVGGSLAGSLGAAAFGISGFGPQILGSAIGAQLELLVKKANELGIALKDLDMEKLKESGIKVNKELSLQIANLKEIGDIVAARSKVELEIFKNTGAMPGVHEGITNVVKDLGDAWSRVSTTVGTTLGVLAAPFMIVLKDILNLVNGIFVVINAVMSPIAAVERSMGELMLGSRQYSLNMWEASEAGKQARIEAERKLRIVKEEMALSGKLLRSDLSRPLTNSFDDKRTNIGIDFNSAVAKADFDLNRDIKNVYKDKDAGGLGLHPDSKAAKTEVASIHLKYNEALNLAYKNKLRSIALLDIEEQKTMQIGTMNIKQTMEELLLQRQINDAKKNNDIDRVNELTARQEILKVTFDLNAKLQEDLTLEQELQEVIKANLKIKGIQLDLNSKLTQSELEVLAIQKEIGVAIKDGLVDGINAAIDGTKTLGEVASNVFRKISNALLNYGVEAALIGMTGGTGGFFSNVFGRASGGPVKGGSPYVVGEKGPELFVPGSSGNIVPNHAMGGANVVVNVDASGSSVEGDAGAAQELGSMLAAAIQAELVKEKRPGGLLA
jgi:hypothetical protein